jgi:hypothetical protein
VTITSLAWKQKEEFSTKVMSQMRYPFFIFHSGNCIYRKIRKRNVKQKSYVFSFFLVITFESCTIFFFNASKFLCFTWHNIMSYVVLAFIMHKKVLGKEYWNFKVYKIHDFFFFFIYISYISVGSIKNTVGKKT